MKKKKKKCERLEACERLERSEPSVSRAPRLWVLLCVCVWGCGCVSKLSVVSLAYPGHPPLFNI